MKYNLNIPDDLHSDIKVKAYQCGKTINQYILDRICANPNIRNMNQDELNAYLAKNTKEQPTPSRCGCETVTTHKPECENGYKKLYKKSPSKLNSEALKGICEKCNEWVKRKDLATHKCKSPSKKPKEYGYPKSKSLK